MAERFKDANRLRGDMQWWLVQNEICYFRVFQKSVISEEGIDAKTCQFCMDVVVHRCRSHGQRLCFPNKSCTKLPTPETREARMAQEKHKSRTSLRGGGGVREVVTPPIPAPPRTSYQNKVN